MTYKIKQKKPKQKDSFVVKKKKVKIKNIYGEDVTENIERVKRQFKRGDISETTRDDNIYAIEQGEMY